MNIYKFNINKIEIYPFGGVTYLDDVIDKPLYQELIVTLMGPIFQELLYLLIIFLNKNNYITTYIFDLYKNYNYSILLFNLLPILPLDGSKLINIVLNKIFNFRLSYVSNIIVSIFTLCIFVFLYKYDSSYYLIMIFLVFQIIYSIKNKNIIYNKFLLEKRLYKNEYKKYKKINSIDNMSRNKKHLVKDNNMYVMEGRYLKKHKF